MAILSKTKSFLLFPIPDLKKNFLKEQSSVIEGVGLDIALD